MRPTKEKRKKYYTDYSKDSDFASAARLHQSKWRANKKFPFAKYGNFLPTDFAIKEKGNFLTLKIRTLVQYVLFRNSEAKQLIKEDRLWENLLSSQPLCFNLFGEMHFDKKLATKFFRKIFPNRVKSVTEILFEHSPNRADKTLTGDHSAFDVFVEYISTDNDKKGFIGIEVKYVEMPLSETKDKKKVAAAERTYNKHKTEYHRVAKASGLFNETRFPKLGELPLQQIWRDHLLALSILQNKIYQEGFFVFLSPLENEECQIAATNYIQELTNKDELKNHFYKRELSNFIKTLRELHNVDWTRELEERYLLTKQ